MSNIIHEYQFTKEGHLMKQALQIFHSSLDDIKTLLNLSSTLEDDEQKKVIFRSAVVLLIASWEQYVEQLANKSIMVLISRLRNSTTLPEGVKQGIALFTISEKHNNPHVFSQSAWSLADKGWKKAYLNYCKSLTKNLNTASSKNINELYSHILGIRNIEKDWHFCKLTSEECTKKLDNIVDLRHDIAHGANKRINELTEENIREDTSFVSSIAETTYRTVFTHTAELSQTQAIKYSLASACYSSIIKFAYLKENKILSIKEIKSLGSSEQGNHNKLCYEPWALLEKIDKNTRRITNRLIDFHDEKIFLPLEILVFDNGEAIPKPYTREVHFSQLK